MLSYLGLAAITLVITGVLLLVSTRILSRQLQETELRRTVTEILPEIESLLGNESDPGRVREVIRAIENAADIELRFVGPEGQVDTARLLMDRATRSQGPMSARHRPSDLELNRVLDTLLNDSTTISGVPTPMWRSPSVVRLQLDDPSSYLEVRDNAGLTDQFTRLSGIGFLIAAVATLAASAGIGAVVSSGLTKPIVALTGAVKRMQAGDLDARAPVTTRDEVGTLGNQFNAMADELSRNIQALRRERDSLKVFLADASHELRTPLTAMSTFVELMERAEPANPTLVDIRQQLERMKLTVDGLLKLSRLDSGVTSLERDEVPISDLLRDAWSTARSRVGNSGVELDIAMPGGSMMIQGDRRQLQILFENLFCNSLQALPDDGSVVCTISRDSVGKDRRPACLVAVADDGPGIEPDVLPHVFGRFYRAEIHAEGSGLGLAIAKAICEAHGGEISARSPVSGDGGTEIRVLLPFEIG